MGSSQPVPSPIAEATVIADRYEIRQSLGKGGMGEVYLAFDRSTQQMVAVKIVREDARMPGDDEALRQELLLARSVSHPNVCRVHDLAPTPWGPIMVMEHIPGATLHSHIRKKKAVGGFRADEFRKIASESCAGLAAIHGQGLVHGDLKPGNVMVTDTKSVILDFGFAQERQRIAARKPGAPPDGGTPNYMSPERLRHGGASPEDDVYALALTLWEMWTAKVPEPGAKPRQKPMKEQIRFDVPSALSVDEIKQVFRGLCEEPAGRPQAKHMRFFNPMQMTSSPVQVPRERLDAGAPLGRSQAGQFVPGAQALLVTYATHDAAVVGKVFPLTKQAMTLGRRADQDIVVAEPTVSGNHAVLSWRGGSWEIADQGSTNGVYSESGYDRMPRVTLLHGGEAQLGELRVKLVHFGQDAPQAVRARQYLARRDGLTGLLVRDSMKKALNEEVLFAEWAEVPVHFAYYEVHGPSRGVSDKMTILEMLALRRAAQRVIEQTEMMLMSLVPVVAGLTGPSKFTVAMVGPSEEEARHVVEHSLPQIQALLPRPLELSANVVSGRQ